MITEAKFRIIVLCALRAEANPVIRTFLLKRKNVNGLAVYENEDIALIITGTGKVNVQYCLPVILKTYNVKFILNYGICGCSTKIYSVGSMFLINKIYCSESDELFFPDIIYKTDIPELAVVTKSTPEYDELICKYKDIFLVDMEASHIYNFLDRIICPHKIITVKVISDYLEKKHWTNESIEDVLSINIESITDYIIQLIEFDNYKDVVYDRSGAILTVLFNQFKFTSTQQSNLRRLVVFKLLNDLSFEHVVQGFLSTNCNTKHDISRLYHSIISETLS